MPVLFVFVFACSPLLFLLYVRLTKSKTRFICRVWALWAGVVCVDVRDVWTQHAPRKRANWRVLTCGRFSCGRYRFFVCII